MKNSNCQTIIRSCTLTAMLIAMILIFIGYSHAAAAAKEPPAFFLKIAKSIPRIGRSDNALVANSNGPHDDPWYEDSDQLNEIVKRKIAYTSESDTKNWQHFPLAIEGPPELWRTLAGYSSNDPLHRSLNEFDNGLWPRDKRSSNLQP
ncbi:PREDICTED: uncharacterized protein LOC105364940 [Ceratosolen solmsi marchali]|uniref:Uncharacterized protein LOC105364940 n=1 Tax=Ceratosolen solmsi marchali TaxID=326594 RepID=A0AAJ7DYP8_9HYME|nr:PREDICTED: uncharacterized protein LOC105364940 [Ceratosolen solmsi marchali]